MEQNSEQELKQLLDDNKITQEEYEQLLSAMKDKPKAQTPPAATVQTTPKPPKKGMGKAALILFIVFLLLPVIGILISFLVSGLSAGRIGVLVLPLFSFPALLCGLLAFIFGIIAWRTTPGKIAAIGVPVCVLLLPLLAFVSFIGLRYYKGKSVPAVIVPPAAVIKSEMVLVPAGVYKADGITDQFVDAYMIDKYEVTNAQYCEFLNDADPTAQYWMERQEITRSGNSSGYSYTVKVGRENYPINFVSFDDAQAYADWKSQKTGKSYHLPDKFQWQKAAGWDPTQQKLWMYGFQSNTIDATCCNCDNKYDGTLPVGSFNGTGGKKDAKSYYGCYDMSGNVWEWTNEISGSNRVVRGGMWGNNATSCEVAIAISYAPTDRYGGLGFRLVMDVN